MSEKKIRLGKPYIIATIFLLVGAIASVFIVPTLADERGEVLTIFIGTIFLFIMGVLYNLLYFLPIKTIEIRLLLPGVLTIITPIIMKNNLVVGITEFSMVGSMNLMVGLYFYIMERKNKL